MKLLLDQGRPRSTATLLRATGLDVVHTGEVGLANAQDAQILATAAEQHRIIVTLDADFHTLLALSRATNPSVIRIRIEGLKAPELADLLRDVLAKCEQDLTTGAMISVQENRIRLRLLPVE